MDELKEVWPQISRSFINVSWFVLTIFGFYDHNYVENDNNLIFYHIYFNSHLDVQINNGKNCVFWPPLCTFDVLTYVTWQRQDDVTYADMCLPSIGTDTYDEAIFRNLNQQNKKVTEGKTPEG